MKKGLIYRILNLFFLFLLSISIFKIAFCGVQITSVIKIGDVDVKLNEQSKVNIVGNDLGLHEEPLWVHVETSGEYNKRIDNSIRVYEHDYKMSGLKIIDKFIVKKEIGCNPKVKEFYAKKHT